MMFRVVRFAPDTMLRTMASATGFLKFSALAFVTLSVALVLLSIFYRLIESALGLDGFRKEAVIAVIASTVQGAGFWFSASLFPPQRLERAGDGRHPLLSIDHNRNGIFLADGQFKLATITVAAFIGGLAVIGSIAKSL